MNVTGNRDKESRKHCESSGWPQRDSAEHKEYAGALADSGITENNITNADRPEGGLLEEILCPNNLNQAYKRVKKNKGAGGVDGMQVEELLQYLKDNGEEIRQSIKDGKYRPQHRTAGRNTQRRREKEKVGNTNSLRPGHTTGDSPGSNANL